MKKGLEEGFYKDLSSGIPASLSSPHHLVLITSANGRVGRSLLGVWGAVWGAPPPRIQRLDPSKNVLVQALGRVLSSICCSSSSRAPPMAPSRGFLVAFIMISLLSSSLDVVISLDSLAHSWTRPILIPRYPPTSSQVNLTGLTDLPACCVPARTHQFLRLRSRWAACRVLLADFMPPKGSTKKHATSPD